MLEAAIVLQLAIGERLEASIIAALLLFNVALSIFQEGRANAALAALKSRLSLKAFVMRDGRWSEVPAAELAPGDIIKLSVGGIVPADARILEGSALLDQSMLTGESVPVEIGPGENAYAGATVRRGTALAEITATGLRTYLGKTAELVRIAHAESGEQKAVFGIVRNLAVFNGAVVVLLVAYARFLAMPVDHVISMVLTALLASIPVALPATFTLAAALSAQVLAKKGVLLTRLSAVHEAAMVDVLCADKTGTLTCNRLSVSMVKSTKEGVCEGDVLALAAMASSDAGPDPVDAAIWAALRKQASSIPKAQILRFTPFDPATKIAEALITDASGAEQRIVKGAPAAVEKIAHMEAQPTAELNELSREGYRVLAVAAGPPQRVSLVGLIGLSDPPRPHSKELIAELRSVGVHTVMVTGDAAATAATVAAAIDLEGRICPTGTIPDSVGPKDFAIYAGVFPEDKFRLVKAFQRNGHTVGMCGDGVNDAPALRQAQMGIAVSTATDVAKAAASMVLMEPGLVGIVSAIKEGRSAFQHILAYTLNALVKKFLFVPFLGACLILTGHAILTPMLMAMLLITGDFITMSLTTDRATSSPAPDAWRVRAMTAAAAILSVFELAFAAGVIAIGKNGLGLVIEELRSLAFFTLVCASQATVYVVRDRKHMWHSRPSGWLVLSSFLDLGIATSLVISGTLMAPLRVSIVAMVLAATIAFSIVLDGVKFVAFKRLRLVPARGDQPVARETGHRVRWSWLAPASALVVLALGGEWLYRSLHERAAVHYITQKVERGSVIRTLTARGTVAAAATVDVRAHVSGAIEALFCDYRTKVKAGQLCAKIDPRPFQRVVDRDEADLAEAKARLVISKAGLASKRAIFERNEARAKRRAVSRRTLYVSKRAYERASILTRLDEDLLAKRQEALHAAGIDLSHTDIITPTDGMVVSRNVKTGQTITASKDAPPVFLIVPDLTIVHVEVEIDPHEINEIHPGDNVSFVVDSFPDRQFTGEVSQIAQSPEAMQNCANRSVVISAPNPNLLLQPGMTATIEIIIGRRNNVMRVLDEALRYSPAGHLAEISGSSRGAPPQGSARLWILRDGTPIPVMVQLGPDDGVYTEVVKGDLTVGDEIIVGESGVPITHSS